MKKLLFLFFGLLVFAGCKKSKEDPKPKAASETVAGSYTLTSFKSNDTFGTTVALPTTFGGSTYSGTAVATAVAGQDSQVNMVVTLKQSGQADRTFTYNGVLLQAASTGYTMSYQGQNVGTADGTNMTVVKDDVTVTAKK